jgi:hypothetical protein
MVDKSTGEPAYAVLSIAWRTMPSARKPTAELAGAMAG